MRIEEPNQPQSTQDMNAMSWGQRMALENRSPITRVVEENEAILNIGMQMNPQ